MLANANVHSLLIAGLLVSRQYSGYGVRRSIIGGVCQQGQLLFLSLAAVLIFGAALFAIKTTLPDERTVATHAFQAKKPLTII